MIQAGPTTIIPRILLECLRERCPLGFEIIGCKNNESPELVVGHVAYEAKMEMSGVWGGRGQGERKTMRERKKKEEKKEEKEEEKKEEEMEEEKEQEEEREQEEEKKEEEEEDGGRQRRGNRRRGRSRRRRKRRKRRRRNILTIWLVPL